MGHYKHHYWRLNWEVLIKRKNKLITKSYILANELFSCELKLPTERICWWSASREEFKKTNLKETCDLWCYIIANAFKKLNIVDNQVIKEIYLRDTKF